MTNFAESNTLFCE